jgi:hypothetical protein
MSSQAYKDWVKDGQPWKFARPIKAVGELLRAHGYTVYYQGNVAHLTHEPPEDHTPFSATGWPGKSPYPYCMAMDIMPPAAGQKSRLTGQPLPSLAVLAAQLRTDKIKGEVAAEFVKYLNWEPSGPGGPCYHESWMPTYARRTSSDRGHIHVSARSDVANSVKSDGYDLVARVMGDTDTMSAADAKQGIADAFQAAADTTDDSTSNDTSWGRQFRESFNKTVDYATAPLYTSLANLSALVVKASPATPAEFAAAVAPLINAQIGDGATPAEVEEVVRRVFGGLDSPAA